MNIISVLLFAFILTSPLPPGSSGWMPSWTTEMGVSFSNPPEAGSEFTEVTGTVNDPEMLMTLGFENITKGDKVTVYNFYSANFTVSENGTKYTPAIIRMEVGSQYQILAPQRGKSELKSLANGDKNAKPAGNGWIPSFTTEMGVSFINPPEKGQSFTTVTGTVSDPEPLKLWGFNGLKQGQNISVSQEVPLKLQGTDKAIVRISSDNFYEVLVVEDGGEMVPITRYW
jgi:hypothetical protein